MARRNKRPRPTPAKTAPKEITTEMVTNAAASQMSQYFANAFQNDVKHDNNYDFGYPQEVTFDYAYSMYRRNGIAKAGVDHAINRTWREFPEILEKEEAHDETKIEVLFAGMAKRLSLWQKLTEVDMRSRVGMYSGAILQLGDGKRFADPVSGKLQGYDNLIDVIPAWEKQLTVSEWYTDETDRRYGTPKMYMFSETAVSDEKNGSGRQRSFQVHPDRVIIWSRDGQPFGTSVLEAGYNDLVTIQKVIGSGGEGFWKNAKNAPVISFDKDVSLQSIAGMLGTTTDQISDKLDEVIAGWQRGFDQLLAGQGMNVNTLGITLPQPAEFVMAPLQSFAASINEPLKILIGSQSGERASTEDAKEWDSTIMSRREKYVKPNLDRFLDRLIRFGIIPALDWYICWTDLTEDSTQEKLAKAKEMATINKEMLGSGDGIVFRSSEIREAAGYESDEDIGLDEPDDLEDEDEQ